MYIEIKYRCSCIFVHVYWISNIVHKENMKSYSIIYVMLWEFQIGMNLWIFFLNQKKISKYWHYYYYKRIKNIMPFLTKNKYMYYTSTSIYE